MQPFTLDTIVISHGIKGYKHYFFSGNDLFQLEHCPGKRTRPLKVLAKQYNGGSDGYYLNRKFKSLTWINKRKYPITKVIIKNTIKQWWEE